MAEIRFIGKSEWPKLMAFNQAEYHKDHILTNKTYYDWQFDNFANGDKKNYSSLGIFGENGELWGTFGLFTLPFSFFGDILTATCLANLIVKKDLRNLGYGYLLLKKASDLNQLAIDHTINNQAWPMFVKAGWQGENLKRFLYIISPKNELYQAPVSLDNGITRSSLRFDSVNEFDSSLENFWQRVKNRYPVTIERNLDYLSWRYLRHPLIKYRIFVVKDGFIVKALVVLRLEKVKQDGSHLGVRVGRMVDFVAEAAAEEFALARTIAYCRRQRVDFIDYFFSGSFHMDSLQKSGFVNGDTLPYNGIPILFNPISFKRTHLNFAVKAKRPTVLTDWYTTKADGDQDRP